MNDQKRFGSTGQGPRATNRPYASPRSNDPKYFRQAVTQENKSVPENTNGKGESVRNFRDLKVWQTAKEIAVIIYKITLRFPQEELYGLSSQMRRAAISISSNIAEGFNRFYKKDYQRFLMIALGSCGELESQIEVGTALGYVPQEAITGLLETLNHENRMLRKLHTKLGEEQRPHRGPWAEKHAPASQTNEAVPLQY